MLKTLFSGPVSRSAVVFLGVVLLLASAYADGNSETALTFLWIAMSSLVEKFRQPAVIGELLMGIWMKSPSRITTRWKSFPVTSVH